MTWRSLLLTVGVAVATVVAGAPASAAPPGLQLRGVAQLTPRLTEVRVFSPTLARETSMRVLTPLGFDARRDHLPVLWLLHGGVGSFRDWTAVGQAEQLTAGLPLIVVMPHGGPGGWYSDWQNPSTGDGPQLWETYHVHELMPFIEARYQTRTDRAGRAIVGLSMGGFGAIHYAARHPDLYGFAAAFSGAVDILHPGITAVADISPIAQSGLPDQIWGNRVLNESTWRANNPVDLAANLRTVETQLRTGNGMPGGPHGGGPDIQEAGVSQATATLHARLDALGIAHLYNDYGPGAHTFDYWVDDLRATLPRIVASAAERRPTPTTVDHIAFEPTFSVWGYDVALRRRTMEPVTLSIRPDGFALRGRGTGTVTTAARYRAREQVRATITTNGGRRTVRNLIANAQGRVVVPVALKRAGMVNVTLAPVPVGHAGRAPGRPTN